MVATDRLTRLLRRYWRDVNSACAVFAFLFGILLICWGPQATVFNDGEIEARIEEAGQIESLRSECRVLNARMKFAHEASETFSGVAMVFAVLVFAVAAFNVRLIRQIEGQGGKGVSE